MENMAILGWLVLSLIFIGLFAGVEIAFISANRLSIELKKKQGKLSGQILSSFVESPAKFLGTCLVGNNILLVIYGLMFSELMRQSLWNPFDIQNEYIKLVFDTLLSTLIVLI